VVPLVIGGVLAALIATARRPDPTTEIEVSGPMPAIDRESMNGRGRVGPPLFQDKVVLVNFWASWCGPCRAEQPGLSRLWERYRSKGVQFLGVNFMDDRAAGRAYLEEFDVAYPSIEDRTGIIAHRFGVPYLPATVLVDAGGEMRMRLVGAQTEAEIERHLEQLLGNATAR
jgi:thiol-disulfide isomerase/thioredoxin